MPPPKIAASAFVAAFIALLLAIPAITEVGADAGAETGAAGAQAENLYLSDSLQVEMRFDGSFVLEPSGGNPRLREARASAFLFPRSDYRQQLEEIDTLGTISDDAVTFSWEEPELGEHHFSYTVLVTTNNRRREVRNKVPFPLEEEDVSGLDEYLLPSPTIDSGHPDIIARATGLAEGEDDLFAVAVKLASWVGENVQYDLKTLDISASEKASWVLQNRRGVCDEMTSLFVAMMRALGVPARFVSGISYTTDEEVIAAVGSNWAPHGWAEVYFPGVGWVGFDITFGEYGYVDVTHIKLRDGFDPQEPATKYEWIASDVTLRPQGSEPPLVLLHRRGNPEVEYTAIEAEAAAGEVGFQSYNVVKGIVTNNAPYYAATTLQLALPPELEIIGRNRRTVLLLPNEATETYWSIKLSDSLEPGLIYTFPIQIYSEKSISRETSFSAREGAPFYSLQDIQQLTIQDEDKRYSRKLSISCSLPGKILLGKEAGIDCTAKNRGNVNLQELQFCIGTVCTSAGLPINQAFEQSAPLDTSRVGWNKVIVSAENSFVEKRTPVEYLVLDVPRLLLEAEPPAEAWYGEPLTVPVSLRKVSFSNPQNLVITVRGLGSQQRWEIEELAGNYTLPVRLDGKRLARKNEIFLRAQWQDGEENVMEETATINIAGSSRKVLQAAALWLNSLLNVLT